jgi:site-specific DNA-methyltransferase (adenine-specific)
MAMTSPPYWGKREYENADGIGLEKDFREYIDNILIIFEELRRVI